MSAVAVFHTALGTLSLSSGAIVLLRPKGTRWHRRIGKVYAVSMIVLCLASFGLQDTTPFFAGYGPFHIAALISLVTVSGGLWAAWRRRENWLEGHYQWMAWSYIGLVMATGGHVMRPIFLLLRDAGLPPMVGLTVSIFVVWGVPPLVGSRWIARRQADWRSLSPS